MEKRVEDRPGENKKKKVDQMEEKYIIAKNVLRYNITIKFKEPALLSRVMTVQGKKKTRPIS